VTILRVHDTTRNKNSSSHSILGSDYCCSRDINK